MREARDATCTRTSSPLPLPPSRRRPPPPTRLPTAVLSAGVQACRRLPTTLNSRGPLAWTGRGGSNGCAAEPGGGGTAAILEQPRTQV